MGAMQKLAGLMRRAIEKYDMIQPNDRIAVGVSGGKDSVALLVGLCKLREYIGIPYEVVAITLDPCFGGVETDYTPIAQLCEQLGVPYVLKRTEIGQIIFDVRNESNPCSLCARMRRGCLHDAAKENNCNKIALGHHYDDAIETFIMNLFQEGAGRMLSAGDLSVQKGFDDDSTDGDGGGEHDFGSGAPRGSAGGQE